MPFKCAVVSQHHVFAGKIQCQVWTALVHPLLPQFKISFQQGLPKGLPLPLGQLCI